MSGPGGVSILPCATIFIWPVLTHLCPSGSVDMDSDAPQSRQNLVIVPPFSQDAVLFPQSPQLCSNLATVRVSSFWHTEQTRFSDPSSVHVGFFTVVQFPHVCFPVASMISSDCFAPHWSLLRYFCRFRLILNTNGPSERSPARKEDRFPWSSQRKSEQSVSEGSKI